MAQTKKGTNQKEHETKRVRIKDRSEFWTEKQLASLPHYKKVMESLFFTSVTSQTIRGASNNRTIDFCKLRSSVTKSNDFSWTNKGKVLRIKD